MTNPNESAAARIVARAIVHGTSTDPALEAVRALDDAGLLAPGRTSFRVPSDRPVSPSALAVLAESGRAKDAAYMAGVEHAGMPGAPAITAAGGEVTFVVHPRSVADWKQWTHALGVGDERAESTGTSMSIRCTYGGVRARLVGVGVPALYDAQFGPIVRRGSAVRP